MKTFTYLKSEDSRVHVINAVKKGSVLTAGILCTVSKEENKCRIADENNSFVIELPEGTFARGSRVKAFNVDLTVLKDE